MRLYRAELLPGGGVHVFFPPIPHDQLVLAPVRPFLDRTTDRLARAPIRRPRATPPSQPEFPQFRGRWAWKGKTIPNRPLSRKEKAEGKALRYWLKLATEERPKTRADCKAGPRPCPWVACSYHLYSDVSANSGSLKINFPRLPVDVALKRMRDTCALDVAEAGGATLDEVGIMLNVSMERARQVVESAVEELAAKVDSNLLAVLLRKRGVDEHEDIDSDIDGDAEEDTGA